MSLLIKPLSFDASIILSSIDSRQKRTSNVCRLITISGFKKLPSAVMHAKNVVWSFLRETG